MNRNYMFLGFIAVAVLGVVGAAFLYMIQSPGADKFVSYIFSVLSTLGTMGVVLWGLNKSHNQQEKMEGDIQEVKTQTNGNLSARDEMIMEQNNIISELRVKLASAEKENEMIKVMNNE